MSPWWMRPTAEGLEEENRNKPKSETPETPEAAKPVEVNPVPPPAPEPSEQPAAPADITQPDWYVEPTSPAPAPVFVESETALPIPRALPPDVPMEPMEPRFYDEPFEEEEAAGEEHEEVEIESSDDADATDN